jgi:hypothetical protein
VDRLGDLVIAALTDGVKTPGVSLWILGDSEMLIWSAGTTTVVSLAANVDGKLGRKEEAAAGLSFSLNAAARKPGENMKKKLALLL